MCSMIVSHLENRSENSIWLPVLLFLSGYWENQMAPGLHRYLENHITLQREYTITCYEIG